MQDSILGLANRNEDGYAACISADCRKDPNCKATSGAGRQLCCMSGVRYMPCAVMTDIVIGCAGTEVRAVTKKV